MTFLMLLLGLSEARKLLGSRLAQFSPQDDDLSAEFAEELFFAPQDVDAADPNAKEPPHDDSNGRDRSAPPDGQGS